MTFKKEQNVIQNPTHGFVYIIECLSVGRCKIGMTNRGINRPLGIITELPFPATIVYFMKTDYPRDLEGFLHKKLKSYRVYREWFNISSEDVLNFINANGLDETEKLSKNHEFMNFKRYCICGKLTPVGVGGHREHCSNACKQKKVRNKKNGIEVSGKDVFDSMNTSELIEIPKVIKNTEEPSNLLRYCICGKLVSENGTSRRRYCSKACKQKDYRNRSKGVGISGKDTPFSVNTEKLAKVSRLIENQEPISLMYYCDCGKLIPRNKGSLQKYCSSTCSRRAHRNRKKIKVSDKDVIDSKGNDKLSKSSASIISVNFCVRDGCTKPIPGKSSSRRKYCSDACRQKDYRNREESNKTNGQKRV
jgi:hypothetical protein